MAICKWCGDRYGGCVHCGTEVELREKARTEQIKNWTPPPDWLIEWIEGDKSLEELGIHTGDMDMGDRLAIVMLQSRLSDMSQEQRKDFAASLKSPPPLFSANQNSKEELEILKRHYSAQVVSADVTQKDRPDIYERAEQARIELAMLKVRVDKHGRWQR